MIPFGGGMARQNKSFFGQILVHLKYFTEALNRAIGDDYVPQKASHFGPGKYQKDLDAPGSNPSLFWGRQGMVGVAASKNSQVTWTVGNVHRSGTSIYRKKIDTQKVYISKGPAQGVGMGKMGGRAAGVGLGHF